MSLCDCFELVRWRLAQAPPTARAPHPRSGCTPPCPTPADLDVTSRRALGVLRPLRVVITNLPDSHFEEVEAKVGAWVGIRLGNDSLSAAGAVQKSGIINRTGGGGGHWQAAPQQRTFARAAPLLVLVTCACPCPPPGPPPPPAVLPGPWGGGLQGALHESGVHRGAVKTEGRGWRRVAG